MGTVAFADFGGGLYLPEEIAPTTPQPTLAIPANALRVADNLDFLPTGAVIGRRGARQVNATPQPGPIQCIRRFVLRDPGGSRQGFSPGFTYDLAIASGHAWQIGGDSPSARCVIEGTAGHSDFLAVQLGFSDAPIPPNATVVGLGITIAGIRTFQSAAHPWTDYKVLLLNAAGVIAGQTANGRANGSVFDAPTTPPDLAQTADYGGPADLWDIVLTPAIVNDPGFAVGFAVQVADSSHNFLETASLAAVVYYTVPAASQTIVGAGDGAADIVYQLLDVSTGLFTPITGGTVPASGRRPWIIDWPEKSKLFIFDGLNPPQVYDGSTMAPLTADFPHGSEIEPPRGPFAVLHQGRIYASNPGEEQFAVYACEVEQERIWLGASEISVNDELGGRIRGLASYNGVLIVLKDTSVWHMLGDILFPIEVRQVTQTIGCVASNTVATTPQGVMFLSRDGLYLTDGYTVQELSRPLRALFTGRTDASDQTYTNAVGLWFPRRGQYWLSLDPTQQVAYVLQQLRDPQGQPRWAWSRVTGVSGINCGEVFELAGDVGDLYLGDIAGLIFQRDVGSADGGAAYNSSVVSYDLLLDPKTRRLGRIHQARPYFRGRSAVAMGLFYDGAIAEAVTLAAGATFGDPIYQSPRTFIADQTAFGRTVAMRVTSTEGPDFELHRVDLDTRMRSRREWPVA